MILNANIPLRTSSPTRQTSWRVGVFLGIFLLSFACGFLLTKKLFIGIRIPYLATPSGVSLRVTPEHALWLTTHTAGYAMNSTCPIDLPTLLSWSQPSMMMLGDSGQEEIFLIGTAPKELKNIETAFACTITPQKKGYSLGNPAKELRFTTLLSLAYGHAWQERNFSPLALHDWGISIAMPTSFYREDMLWPNETLTQALPITQEYLGPLSHQFQGMSTLLAIHTGKAMFSWKKEAATAFGIVVTEDVSDEDLLSIVYALADIPRVSQRIEREDGTRYTAYAYQTITLSEIHDGMRKAQLPDATPVGFLTYQDGVIGISTMPTTWELLTPHWNAQKNTHTSLQYVPRTLVTLGNKIFFTKQGINILTGE